jgi:phage terminase large subunit-like protein
VNQVDPRWIRTKSDEQAVKDGCYFDLAAAERVREFFGKFIRHTTGKFSGKPFILLAWQWEYIIAPLFGWKRADGMRRFSVGFIEVAKKNGKSTLLAGIGIYLALADREESAEVFIAAADRDQASIIYREAAKMVRKSRALESALTPKDSVKTIFGPRGAFIKALSAEVNTKEGLNAHGILFDELHAQKGRELWDCLRYAGAAREQPLLLSITTAGGDLETICGEQYQYAKQILSGERIATDFFVYIAEASNKDDWAKEETWHKANPSLGVTIPLEAFRKAYEEARDSPAKENSFRRYRLNQWVQAADAWLSMDHWDSCAAEPLPYAGKTCDVGLDLSATDDTTALVQTFGNELGGVDIVPHFFLPELNIDALERKHKVPYRAWAKKGLLTLTPGNVVDYAVIRKRAREIHGETPIRQLSIDRKFQGQQLELDLIEDGFNVFPAGQGWASQDLPAKELEKLLKASRIRHSGHPILRWHASNVVVDIDKANNYSINKKRSRSKIDGIAALLMAIYCHMQGGGNGELYVNSNPNLIVL